MTLFLYFARKFLWFFTALFLIFLIIMALIDMVEQLQKFAGTPATFRDVVELTLLKAVGNIYRIMPLIVVLATVALFLNLARSSELVAARAAGRSALRILGAPVSVAVLLGVMTVAILNPLVAATSKRYEARANRFTHGVSSVMSVSPEGLWLRQGGADGQTVIRAQGSNLDATRLVGVSFFSFGPKGAPLTRIEARSARLGDGAWHLRGAKLWPLKGVANPELAATLHDRLTVASNLTREQIRDSFGTPSAIAIWDLPSFIASLERAGFSARAHRVWLQMELAKPLLFAAMVLLGAVFTLQPTRFGHTGIKVLAAVLTGFGLFFIRNFMQILGGNGQIPVALAAWAPPLVAISLALALLLHLEDG